MDTAAACVAACRVHGDSQPHLALAAQLFDATRHLATAATDPSTALWFAACLYLAKLTFAVDASVAALTQAMAALRVDPTSALAALATTLLPRLLAAGPALSAGCSLPPASVLESVRVRATTLAADGASLAVDGDLFSAVTRELLSPTATPSPWESLAWTAYLLARSTAVPPVTHRALLAAAMAHAWTHTPVVRRRGNTGENPFPVIAARCGVPLEAIAAAMGGISRVISSATALGGRATRGGGVAAEAGAGAAPDTADPRLATVAGAVAIAAMVDSAYLASLRGPDARHVYNPRGAAAPDGAIGGQQQQQQPPPPPPPLLLHSPPPSAALASSLGSPAASESWMIACLDVGPTTPPPDVVHHLAPAPGAVEALTVRVGNTLGDILPPPGPPRRVSRSTALFYVTLGTMLATEAGRLIARPVPLSAAAVASSVARVGSAPKLQRALLVLSAGCTHHGGAGLPPGQWVALATRAGVTAWDVHKLMDDFVRCAPALPRPLVRALSVLGDALIDSHVWAHGSPLAELLAVTAPAVAAEVARAAGGGPATPAAGSPARLTGGESAPSGVPSPAPPGTPATTPSAAADPPSAVGPAAALARVVASGRLPAAAVVNHVLSKLCALMGRRLGDLCERLRLSAALQAQATALVSAAAHEHTALLYGRQADCIMLAALFGVCKINAMPVRFADILVAYRGQPHFVAGHVGAILLDPPPGGDTAAAPVGDAIAFYNRVFLSRDGLKSRLLSFDPARQPLPPGGEGAPGYGQGIGHTGPTSATVVPSPHRGSGGAGPTQPPPASPMARVHVSPMRDTRVTSLAAGLYSSPGGAHSRALYAFVGQATQALQSPSRDISALNDRLRAQRTTEEGGAAAVPMLSPGPPVRRRVVMDGEQPPSAKRVRE